MQAIRLTNGLALDVEVSLEHVDSSRFRLRQKIDRFRREGLREIGTSVAIAYAEHRGSMYGKPPPYDR